MVMEKIPLQRSILILKLSEENRSRAKDAKKFFQFVYFIIPMKTGIKKNLKKLDSPLRGNDGKGSMKRELTPYPCLAFSNHI